MRLPHTVTWIEPSTGEDRRGDTTLTYGSGVEVAGWMQQNSAAESFTGDGRDRRTARWTLFSDQTAGMTSLARIVWDGRTFRVAGDPNHLWDDEAYHHTEAALEVVEG